MFYIKLELIYTSKQVKTSFMGIRPFSVKSCVSGAGAKLCVKQDICSENFAVDLLHSGVGGAEL
jgi:hypothetical protein